MNDEKDWRKSPYGREGPTLVAKFGPVCAKCGFSRDRSIHQPPLNAPPDAPRFGHPFVPRQP